MNTIEDCTCGARVSAFGIMGAWQCDDRKTCRLREHLAEVRSPNLKLAVKLEDFAEKVTDHLVRSTTEVGLTEDQYRTMWGADGGGLRYDDGKARYDLIPTDDEGADYVKKHAGKLAQVKVSQPRSLEQNSMLWGVAGVCYSNLPERLTAKWADEHTMVKGLQLRLGIVNEVATWDERGWRIVATPKSIAGMGREEANVAVDKLIDGMAALLGISVGELLNEYSRRAAE